MKYVKHKNKILQMRNANNSLSKNNKYSWKSGLEYGAFTAFLHSCHKEDTEVLLQAF